MTMYTVRELILRLNTMNVADPTLADAIVVSEASNALAAAHAENAQLRQTLAHRLRELYQAQWLIRNGEKHFGSLWRDATAEDIRAIAERSSEPQTG
jgi:hypothetical protein